MKQYWKQITITLIVGLIVGMAVGRWSVHYRMRHFESPEKKFERKFKWFSKKLNLSEEQKIKVKDLLKQKHEKMMAIQEEMSPRYKGVRDSVQSEIRLMLNSKQQKKFAKLEEKRKKWREKRRGRFHNKSW